MAQWAAIFGGRSQDDEEGGSNPLVLILFAILAPIAAMLVQFRRVALARVPGGRERRPRPAARTASPRPSRRSRWPRASSRCRRLPPRAPVHRQSPDGAELRAPVLHASPDRGADRTTPCDAARLTPYGRPAPPSSASSAALAPPAFAEPPATVFLEELTWNRAARLVQGGKTTIIVPIGGTEQNGPHMALGKHNARVKALAERIARALGNALVAPVIAYVPRAACAPSPATCDSRERSPSPTTCSSGCWSRRRVASGSTAFATSSSSAITARRRPARTPWPRLNREWTTTPVRAHAIEEYYRAGHGGIS